MTPLEPGHIAEYVLPEGMTAEKLRALAHWLDLHDKPGASNEVQGDLRRWAAQIDGQACPRCGSVVLEMGESGHRYCTNVGCDWCDHSDGTST